MQQMEAQMQHDLLLHKKSLSDRQQHLQTLTAGISKKRKLNKQLQYQTMELADLLDDQVPAIDAMTAKQDTSRSALDMHHNDQGHLYLVHGISTTLHKAARAPLLCRPRFRGLQALRKLQDIMKAQEAEIANLKNTLHKLHLRSYPAFVDPTAAVDSATIPAARGRAGDVLKEKSKQQGP
jgi:hypothetical protein